MFYSIKLIHHNLGHLLGVGFYMVNSKVKSAAVSQGALTVAPSGSICKRAFSISVFISLFISSARR